jgi:alanyl-tRNA synthetase
LLEQVLERERGALLVPGREMFTLYDTHGLPPELTLEVAAQRGYAVDRAGFDAEMAGQRIRSRGEGTFGAFEDPRAERYAAMGLQSAFTGYEATETHAPITEGGGQVGDRGEIASAEGRFRVEDTQRTGNAITHLGTVLTGTLVLGASADARVDGTWRAGSARNHTATHLLHAALRATLGEHVRQAGSYVGPDRLRFDYTHPESTTPEQLRTVQRMVNAKVRDDIERETIELPYEQAIARGAIAFFEDRYAADVRMVEYCETHAHNPADGHTHGDCFSRELCGGTHLHSTGGVGMLQIVSDASIGAGMRRIEALTGPEAERYLEERLDVVGSLAQRFKVPPEEVGTRVEALEAQLTEERRRAGTLARQAAEVLATELAAKAETIGTDRLVVERVTAENVEALRALGDSIRKLILPRLPLDQPGVAIVLGAVIGTRPMFLAIVTDDLVARGVRADALVREAATIAGGTGGGRPQIAQAGGRDPSKLDAALDAVRRSAREQLAAAH